MSQDKLSDRLRATIYSIVGDWIVDPDHGVLYNEGALRELHLRISDGIDATIPAEALERDLAEPVAWMDPDDGLVCTRIARETFSGASSSYTVPLFAHPPKEAPVSRGVDEWHCEKCGGRCHHAPAPTARVLTDEQWELAMEQLGVPDLKDMQWVTGPKFWDPRTAREVVQTLRDNGCLSPKPQVSVEEIMAAIGLPIYNHLCAARERQFMYTAQSREFHDVLDDLHARLTKLMDR